MRLDEAESNSKSRSLGLAAAMMIAAGYYGELVVTGDFSHRWICGLVSMILASYIVYERLARLAPATAQERCSFAVPRALSEGSKSTSQTLLQVFSGRVSNVQLF